MTTFQIARADGKTLEIQGKMANRHGLIAGATGTGKTVTLRRMAEAFSSEGIPVFLVDVKGDLSGIAQAGTNSGKVGERIAEFDLGEQWLQNFPCAFGMFTAKPVFPYASPFQKWALCFWHA